MAETRTADRISAVIRDVTGSMIAVGKNIFQIKITFNIHGIPLFPMRPSDGPQPRPRPLPIKPPPPRPFPDLLDREPETGAASAALQTATPTQLYGPSGIGKTALLQHLAYNGVAARFPDGVTYFSPLSRDYSPSDLLHAVFTSLFEFPETVEGPVRLTDAVLQQRLRERQALVMLDHVELSREDAEGLLQAAASCTFLMASTSRSLWGEARAIELRGLPLDAAMLLLERRGLERSLRAEERAAAEALCTALDGNPLSILQAAALVRERGRVLDEVAVSVQPQPTQALVSEIQASLNDEERKVLAVLAALHGSAVGVEHLSAITELPNVERVLDSLNHRFLVQAHSPRYSATAIAEQVIPEQEVDRWAGSALEYFVRWAEQYHTTPKLLVQEADAILALMRWATAQERPADVARLARAVDGALALGLRWGAWVQVLDQALQAARRLGDRAVEAWALHQRGSRALCLDDAEEAKRALTEALGIREALGDEVGAAVTRHNLGLLPGPPPGENGPDGRGGPGPIMKAVLVAIAVVALSAGGVVAWNRLAKPVFEANPRRVDFGKREVGTSHAELVEIRSEGRGNLQISAIQLVGPHGDDFRVAPDGCESRTIPPGSRCQVNVVFDPRGVGARSAALKISDNARGSPHEIRLRGIGVRSSGGLVVRPTPADFGQQEVRRTGARGQIVLENRGPGVLSIQRMEVGGPHAKEFRVDESACANARLAARQTCVLAVAFTPSAKGSRSARIVIIHDGTNSPTAVELTGSGVLPGVLYVNPPALDFLPIPVGQSSAVRQVVLRNRGQGPFKIQSVVRAGTHADEFQVVENHCHGTLLPNESCLVMIRFQPTEGATHTASLKITADGQPTIVKLTGAVVSPPTPAPAPTLVGRLEVGPGSVNFDTVRVGEATTRQQVTIRNAGAGPLGIRGIYLAAPGEFSITEDTCGTRTVEPGGQCVVSIVFTPRVEGTRRGVLVISSDADAKRVELIGSATPVPTFTPTLVGRLEVRPEPVNFGPVGVGEATKPQPVTVRNVGSAPLGIRGIYIEAPGEFSVTGDTCGKRTLEPKGQCVVSIVFAPRVEGTRRGVLVVPSDADEKKVGLIGSATAVPTSTPTLVGRLEVRPNPVNFDAVNVGETSQPQQVTIRNAGSGPLAIRGIYIDEPGEFSIAEDTCGTRTLEPGAQCAVNIVFRPRVEGTRKVGLVVSIASGRAILALVGQGVSQVTLRPPESLRPGSLQPDKPEPLRSCVSATLTWAPVYAPRPVYYVVTLQQFDREAERWTNERSTKVRENRLALLTLVERLQRARYRWSVRSSDDAGNASSPSSWYYFACFE